LENKLLDRTTQVFVVIEIAVGSEKRNAIGLSDVSALHQNVHGGGVG